MKPLLGLAPRFCLNGLLAATAATFLVACGGADNSVNSSPAEVLKVDAQLEVTGQDVTVSLSSKDHGNERWSIMSFDFSSTVDAGPSKGTKLAGALKLAAGSPAADGSSDVKGYLIVPGESDGAPDAPPLTAEQIAKLKALTEQFHADLAAARKEFKDAATPIVEKFKADLKAAKTEAEVKALMEKFRADIEIVIKAMRDKVQTLSDQYEADASAITGSTAHRAEDDKKCRAKAIKVEGKLAKDGTITLKFQLAGGAIEGEGKRDANGNFAGTFKGPQTGDTGAWTAAVVSLPMPSPSPTGTPTMSPPPRPTPTASPTPTLSPSPRPTPTASPTTPPTPTPTKSPTPPPSPTPTANPLPNPATGKVLYANNCAMCHRPQPDTTALKAANKSNLILSAIASNTGNMGFLKNTIGTSQAADIAEWLKNPQ